MSALKRGSAMVAVVFIRRVASYLLCCWMALFITGGCQTGNKQVSLQPYQTTQQPPLRDRHQAQALNEQGLHFIRENQPDRAEQAFREAIRADISCGAGHNNLGLILMGQEKFYEAAVEFAFAAKLTPKSTEPVVNLARLYERIGWWKEAQGQYEKVLEMEPDDVDALGRLARCYLQQGKSQHEVLSPLLARLAEQDADEQWRAWAAEALAGTGTP